MANIDGSGQNLVWLWHRCLAIRRRLFDDFKVFCRNGTIVGMRYLFDSGYHITEHWLWLLLLTSALGLGAYLLCIYFMFYNETAFIMVLSSFGSGKLITFPTIAVCEMPAWKTKTFHVDRRRFKTRDWDMLTPEFEDFVRAYIYQDLSVPYPAIERFWNYTQNKSESELSFYQKLDYEQLYTKVNSNCSNLLTYCSWQEQSFPCCQYFKQRLTLLGACYILERPRNDSLNWTLDGTFSNGWAQFDITLGRPAQLFILTNKATPEPYSPFTRVFVMEDMRSTILFGLHLVTNGEGVFRLPTDVLQCHPKAVGQLEFTSCLHNCIRRYQADACHCAAWHLGSKLPHCTLEEHVCLERAGLFPLNRIKRDRLRDCNCFLSCDQINAALDNVYTSWLGGRNSSRAHATIKVEAIPRGVFHRKRVRGSMDVIVSFGGIISCCLGCSFISILELFFITLQRVCCGAYG